MEEVTIIGVDLAKNVFQLYGAAADGSVICRKTLSRAQFQRFMVVHPPCSLAMEACPGGHFWTRELSRMGHVARMISPQYVTRYVKRQSEAG